MQQHEEAEWSLNSGERHAQAFVEFEVEEEVLGKHLQAPFNIIQAMIYKTLWL